MAIFGIRAKGRRQNIQLPIEAETMREAIDRFREHYTKEQYTIIECFEVTTRNR